MQRPNSKTIFLLLTILLAVVYVFPDLNFQETLSQGDHGRDLYAAEQVLHGKLPYKDFWWVYGPLMPYYYGAFYKVFGLHISSILLGKSILVVLCAILFYLSASVIMTPGLAFLAATWFTQSRAEFFFTFNHIGGIVAELAMLWLILSYMKTGFLRYAYGGLLSAFALMLIKINFGLVGLVGLLAGIAFIDWIKKYPFTPEKKKFYLSAIILIPLTALLIHWLLLKDLPIYAIRQCMPYFGDDQPYHASSPITVILYYLQQHAITFTHGPINILLGLLLHSCTALGIWTLFSRRLERNHWQNIILSLAITGLFFIVYFHEFLLSAVWYRQYWSVPFQIFFHFIMISIVFPQIPKILRRFILIFLWGLIALGIVSHIGILQSKKLPMYFLNMERGRIYVGNEPQWIDTVNRVTDYLNTTLQPGESFFALPYDCIYYYLTGKTSPTRQLIFFDHIKITTEQELSIIKELESKNVNYVLLSSRFTSPEHGLGTFGKTYCPIIAKYVEENFKPVARQGGNWDQPPGWGNNHGVLILKRK